MDDKINKKFVIQEHSKKDENTHWDLMLETGNLLETYRLPLPPEKIGEDRINIIKIFDHQLKFLNYEGPVNKGLGSVKIADQGTFESLQQKQNFKKIKFNGKKIKGIYFLKLISDNNWKFGIIQG